MATQTKTLAVGSDLNQLDIFLNVDGVAINASGISFEVFDAAGVLAASGVPTNPATGQYLGSGIVPGSFANGDWRIDWSIIPTGSPVFVATEQFCVQPVTVSFTLAPQGEVITSIYDKVRIDIGDSDGLIFVDSFLQRVLLKAVTRLNNKLGLAPTVRGPTGIPGQFGGQRIRVIPITIDLGAGTINPAGDEYEDLLILQMEHIIKTSEISALKRLSATAASGPAAAAVSSAINDDVEVRNADGVSVRIGGARLQTRANLYRFDATQIKDELDAAVKRFLGRISSTFGKLVY